MRGIVERPRHVHALHHALGIGAAEVPVAHFHGRRGDRHGRAQQRVIAIQNGAELVPVARPLEFPLARGYRVYRAPRLDQGYQALAHALAVLLQRHVGDAVVGGGHEDAPGAVPQVDDIAVPAKVDLLDDGARVAQRIGRGAQVCLDAGVDRAEAEVNVERQLHAADIARWRHIQFATR